MASIQEILKAQKAPSQATRELQENPALVEGLFKPLLNAGFHDFTLVADGSDALLISPVDNDKIVFRISSEFQNRSNVCPFFLSSPYKHELPHKGDRVQLELLLAGKKEVTEKNLARLQVEMLEAGWNLKHARDWNGLIKDVIMVPLRKADQRIEWTPIISDPSAISYYLLGTEPAGHNNKCTADYPTLQDQERSYKAAIAQDERLQKLVPGPVKFAFAPTEIIPTVAAQGQTP